jgi:hypothetical protein
MSEAKFNAAIAAPTPPRRYVNTSTTEQYTPHVWASARPEADSFLSVRSRGIGKVTQIQLCTCEKVCSVGSCADCVTVKPPPLDGRYDAIDLDFAVRLAAAAARVKAKAAA